MFNDDEPVRMETAQSSKFTLSAYFPQRFQIAKISIYFQSKISIFLEELTGTIQDPKYRNGLRSLRTDPSDPIEVKRQPTKTPWPGSFVTLAQGKVSRFENAH
jgi:hypothetical protein